MVEITPVKSTDMIEKIRLIDAISDAEIIEAIRSNMPVATMEKAGLANVNNLKAFQFATFNLKYNESANLGRVTGLMTLRVPSILHYPYVYLVDTFDKSVKQLHGDQGDKSFVFSWEGAGGTYYEELLIVSRFGSGNPNTAYPFYVAWQTIGI